LITIEKSSDILKDRLYSIAIANKNKEKKPQKNLDSDQKTDQKNSQKKISPTISLTSAQILLPTAATTIQASELYKVYLFVSTIYNFYAHTLSVYQQAAQFL